MSGGQPDPTGSITTTATAAGSLGVFRCQYTLAKVTDAGRIASSIAYLTCRCGPITWIDSQFRTNDRSTLAFRPISGVAASPSVSEGQRRRETGVPRGLL